MAALLRGVARSIAVAAAAAGGGSGPAPAAAAAAAAQPITALSTSSVAGAAARAAGAGAGVGVGGGGGGLVAGAGSVSEVLGVVAAERSGGGIGVGVGGGEKTILMAASLPGLLGNGLARPVAASAVSSGGHQLQQQQQQPLLSSSAAFLAHCRLSVRPQAKPVLYGSSQVSSIQNKASESQVVVMEEPSGPPSTSYRERTSSRISEDGALADRDGRMGRSFNPRSRSISAGRTIDPRTRYLNRSVPSDLLQDSEVYRKSPSMPFHSSRELRSSALLDRFDDNEGSDMDVDTYKRMHEITTMGSNVPDPIMTFASTGFPPALMRELENANFSSPSAIQAMTWPLASQSRDVVAVAKTGSGKTLGYLIPAFLRIERERHGRSRNPLVLVLAPTRELANQIRDETWKFGKSSRISCTCICGGASKGPQLRDLDRGVDVIVATPGRLNDLLEMNAVNLKKVSYLVIDEADRMLDMGFEPQIRAIVDQMPPQRQTLMYTATWPHEVRRIARDLLTDPVQVNIGDSDQLSANKNITQKVEIISRYDKERRLEEILTAAGSDSKVLIFCTTKRMCEELAMVLRNKFGALAIHGDKSQRERDYVMNQFKRGRTPVLVATDVAARGLDIKDIRMVVNYDFPTGVEDYVHRIGRTGRAGATGMAHTFFGYEDAKHAAQLIKVLESTGQDVLPALRQMVGRGDSRRGGNSRYGRTGGRPQQGSKWGQNDRFGGDKYGSSSKSGGGSDRYGGGYDRFGSGSDRFGNRNDRPAFNNNRSGNGGFERSNTGNERFGSGGARFGNGSERKSFDRPAQKWGLSGSKSSIQHNLNGNMDGYGVDKSLLTPQYGELKMNPDGTMSLW